MAKQVPLTIKNEEEMLELLGRHEVTDSLDSLKRHIGQQLEANKKSRLYVFLYLEEKET